MILGLGLLWQGGHGLYTAITNRNPTTLSYAEFRQTRPKVNWLYLTNCQLDLVHSYFIGRVGGGVNEARDFFIPLLDPDSENLKTCVLLKTHDDEFVGMIQRLTAISEGEAAQAWVRTNLDRIFPRRNVHGLVRSPLDLESNERSKLAPLLNNVAEDYVILESDAQPSALAGLATGISGFGILAGLVLHWRRK